MRVTKNLTWIIQIALHILVFFFCQCQCHLWGLLIQNSVNYGVLHTGFKQQVIWKIEKNIGDDKTKGRWKGLRSLCFGRVS